MKNIKNGDLKNIITDLPTIIEKEKTINIDNLLKHFNENQICDITDDKVSVKYWFRSVVLKILIVRFALN